MTLGDAAEQERVAVLPVERGLFLLRYSSSAVSRPPRIFVRASPSSGNHLEIVSMPGMPKGVLSVPGECSVVAAEQAGSLQLTIVAVAGGGLSANVDLEPLWVTDGGPSKSGADLKSRYQVPANPYPEKSVERAVRAPKRRVAPSDFSLMCHMARLGDVVAAGAEWVGGPDAPAAVEGIQVNWVPPKGVSLEYQVLVAGANGRWSAWVLAGEFAGSRGRRLPLIGVRLRLGGEKSEGMLLRGEALFLGSTVVSDVGEQLEFTSYAGVDPLVGFRLELIEQKAPEAGGAVVDGHTDNKASRLRVFKSDKSFVIPHVS